MTEHLTDLDAAVDWLLQRVDGPLRIGAPLALGKPHRLLNALYARVENDASRPLQLYTALSLNPPRGGAGLEAVCGVGGISAAGIECVSRLFFGPR